jgi:hypothetical protein
MWEEVTRMEISVKEGAFSELTSERSDHVTSRQGMGREGDLRWSPELIEYKREKSNELQKIRISDRKRKGRMGLSRCQT